MSADAALSEKSPCLGSAQARLSLWYDSGYRPKASEIGVGMAVVGHPSLRTGLADFPHPALQSVSHPLAAGLVRLARAKAYREISPSFSKNALG